VDLQDPETMQTSAVAIKHIRCNEAEIVTPRKKRTRRKYRRAIGPYVIILRLATPSTHLLVVRKKYNTVFLTLDVAI
jgi:hypothetical protein